MLTPSTNVQYTACLLTPWLSPSKNGRLLTEIRWYLKLVDIRDIYVIHPRSQPNHGEIWMRFTSFWCHISPKFNIAETQFKMATWKWLNNLHWRVTQQKKGGHSNINTGIFREVTPNCHNVKICILLYLFLIIVFINIYWMYLLNLYTVILYLFNIINLYSI